MAPGRTSFGAHAVDATGNAVVVLDTTSSDLPASAGLDTTYSGSNDAFVAKISAAGSLTSGTYLGGSSWTVGWGVAVDASGTCSSPARRARPISPSSVGSTPPTTRRATASSRVSRALAFPYGRRTSGVRTSGALRLATTKTGDVVVAGYTTSTDFPSSGGFDKTLGGTATRSSPD